LKSCGGHLRSKVRIGLKAATWFIYCHSDVTTSGNMIIDFLGKIFFPRLQVWQRRREVKTFLTAVLVGLIFAGLAAGLILLRSHVSK
jgi:hypothetical protein